MAATFTSTDNSLFAQLRTIESGTLGGYGATNGNALGAYQMGYSALLAINAIAPSATPKDQSSWVWNPRADFGSSVSDFLTNPQAQNKAAVAYMNILAKAIPADVSAKFGTVQNGALVTQDGYLLAAWHNPSQAPLAASGQSYSTDSRTGLDDWPARAASGVLAEITSGFPFPIGIAGYPAGTTATLSNNNNTLTINGPSGKIVYSILDSTSGVGTISFGGNTFDVNAHTVQAFVAPGGNGQPTLQVATSLDANGHPLSVAQISTTTTGGVTIKNQTTPSDESESDTVTVLRVRTYKIAFPGKRAVIQGSRREPMDDRSPFLADRRSVRAA